MIIIVEIGDNGSTTTFRSKNRSEADAHLIAFVNASLPADNQITAVESAIEFLTLHDRSVKISEYHPAA